MLDGKVVLITGGGRGIGRALALLLAKEGCSIAVVSRTWHEISAVASEIDSLGGRGLAVKADIANAADVKDMVEQVIKAFGGVDILVNNAGAFRHTLIADMKEADWDLLIDINLKGTFLCCREILPQMLKQGSGRIINISSIAGKMGHAGESVYSAAKFGVIGFTESLAAEVKDDNIVVSTVLPGLTNTRMPNEAYDESVFVKLGLEDRTKWLEPEDVASAIINLMKQHPRVTTKELVILPTDEVGYI